MQLSIAVEEVISKHLQKRADRLSGDERDPHANVDRFRDKEPEHLDIAVDHDGHETQV